jgi:hypothetical protein
MTYVNWSITPATKLSVVLDQRIEVMRQQITQLVEEKTEYFKAEIDDFFIKRQMDLARERRRLALNIVLASGAALAVRAQFRCSTKASSEWDMLTVFRVVLASLAGGYSVWLVLSLLRGWLRMSEHRKDMVFLAARYWGWLRPASIFSTLAIMLLLALMSLVLVFPQGSSGPGCNQLHPDPKRHQTGHLAELELKFTQRPSRPHAKTTICSAN